MKHKTRILTLRTLSVLVLVALLAALSPPSLQTGGVAFAQTGAPTLTAQAADATTVDLSWTAVTGADSYDLVMWTSGQSDWVPVGAPLASGTTAYSHTGLTSTKGVLLPCQRGDQRRKWPVVESGERDPGDPWHADPVDDRLLRPDRA